MNYFRSDHHAKKNNSPVDSVVPAVVSWAVDAFGVNAVGSASIAVPLHSFVARESPGRCRHAHTGLVSSHHAVGNHGNHQTLPRKLYQITLLRSKDVSKWIFFLEFWNGMEKSKSLAHCVYLLYCYLLSVPLVRYSPWSVFTCSMSNLI